MIGSKWMGNMKVLLSNAPWYIMDAHHISFLCCRAGSRWPHLRNYKGSMVSKYQPFPFFLATASSLLKKEGFDVILRDSIILGETYEDYYRFVRNESSDIIFLETSTPSIDNDLSIIQHIKHDNPQIKTIIAGLHASVAEESFLKNNPYVDFSIYGEYEHPLLILLKALRDNIQLTNVPNLLYRDNGCIHKTQREALVSIHELPWPDRETLPALYYDGCGGMLGLELQLQTSRGCPFNCNFCVLPQIIYAGHDYRMRYPQDVIKEILYNFQKKPYTHFYFDDDTININKKHFLELCYLISESGLSKYPWGCMGRADLMDDEMLEALKKAGCFSIKYGVESFNQQILDHTGKSMNIEKNIQMITKTRLLGIKVHLTYCLGLLGDTADTVKDNIKKSLMLPADSRQYSIATPFVGSKLWEEYKKLGLIIYDDFGSFDANHTAVVDQESLSSKELITLKNMADLLNREQIQNSVPATFLTTDFFDLLIHTVSKYNSVLIMCTHRNAIIKELVCLLSQVVNNIDVLSEKPFLTEVKTTTTKELQIYKTNEGLCLNEEKKTNTKQYDVVLLPARTFTKEGIENYIDLAKSFSSEVLIIYNNAKLEMV